MSGLKVKFSVDFELSTRLSCLKRPKSIFVGQTLSAKVNTMTGYTQDINISNTNKINGGEKEKLRRLPLTFLFKPIDLLVFRTNLTLLRHIIFSVQSIISLICRIAIIFYN